MPIKRSTVTASDHADGGTPTTRPTFLVVDDDAMVRRIVARGLEALGPAEVLEVEDGLAAQDVLRQKPVDVVVTDVLMPNMSGLELMKWAQDHCPEPLWIVLSGLETFDAAVDALQLGAFDYLGKPPEVQRVRIAVRNALDQIELVRERRRLYEQIERSNAQLAEKVRQLEQLCGMLEEQAAVIQSDLDRAEVIQRALLPRKPPKIEGWCMETLYRTGSSVGGDLYDVILLDRQHVALVIADASGHGVAAAMLSVLFKLRLNFTDNTGRLFTPGEVLGNLNRSLLETLSSPGAFITAAYVQLNLETGRAKIASAGHPPCIRTTPTGESELLARTGPALGIEADAIYEEREFSLATGDRLLMYTDGVLGTGAESFTTDELLHTLCSGIDRAEVTGTLYRAATQNVSGERDDITMILLEHCKGPSRLDDTPAAGDHQAPRASTAQAQVLQGVMGQRAYVSIAGTVTWNISQSFLDTARTLLERSGSLTIDLGDCVYMDSTCLGTLHEVVMLRPEAVKLQRMPDSIRALFEELSMDAVLAHVDPESDPLPEVMEPLKEADVDPGKQGMRILSAHETLASLSPENQEKFQGVVNSLRNDLNQ